MLDGIHLLALQTAALAARVALDPSLYQLCNTLTISLGEEDDED
jgi:hypothetical protein